TEQIKEIKTITEKPIVVGFGISRPEHTRLVASAGADGAVVGSALIDLIEKYETSTSLIDKVKEFTISLRKGLEQPKSDDRNLLFDLR
ncbi:MAG: tryptophan synthase subunit alpha, partial [Candidatus Sumerlaeia bacterium]|nr:tryptophan synthase subunit alpha [Candidatus Sumerlaeia bacterium]